MTDNTPIKPTHAFAVPAMLAKTLNLKVPSGALVSRMNAEADGFYILIDLFSFRSARARSNAKNAFAAEAEKHGMSLKAIACLSEGVAYDLYIASKACVELHSPDEQIDRDFYSAFKDFIDGDFRHIETISHFIGVPIVFFYGQEIVQPPFPSTKNGSITFFSCARPPGVFPGTKLAVTELFGLKIWEHGAKRFVNEVTPGRGRIIEQNGTSVFQILGRNYYQLCLVPSDEHDMANRERVFKKLLEVFYRDLLDHDGTESNVPEATSEELAAFGEEQAGTILREHREDLKKTENKITEAEQKLFDIYGKRDRMVNTIKTLSGAAFIRDLHERLPQECTEIKNIPGVSSVRLVDGAIQIETKSVVINHNGIDYDLGSFVIRLDNGGKPAVWSENPRHLKGHHHPHINRLHLACYGNVTLAIAKHMAAFHYADAARLVIRWLHTYNLETTLTPIEEWAPEKNTGGTDAV